LGLTVTCTTRSPRLGQPFAPVDSNNQTANPIDLESATYGSLDFISQPTILPPMNSIAFISYRFIIQHRSVG
jgi:hypothetical protein